jgi:hypothetical protein
MCSIVGIALAMALAFAVLQGQVTRLAEDKGEETKLQLITQYGDVTILRYFLESHRHDTAVCSLCSRRMTVELCNKSSSWERKALCIDIMQHCSIVCMVS